MPLHEQFAEIPPYASGYVEDTHTWELGVVDRDSLGRRLPDVLRLCGVPIVEGAEIDGWHITDEELRDRHLLVDTPPDGPDPLHEAA